MKALLFVRSSMQDEAVEQSQLDQLRSFAKRQGYDIAGEIVESGVEGLSLDRSGIRQMIEIVSDIIIRKEFLYFYRKPLFNLYIPCYTTYGANRPLFEIISSVASV